jgi:hypothetical protein
MAVSNTAERWKTFSHAFYSIQFWPRRLSAVGRAGRTSCLVPTPRHPEFERLVRGEGHRYKEKEQYMILLHPPHKPEPNFYKHTPRDSRPHLHSTLSARLIGYLPAVNNLQFERSLPRSLFRQLKGICRSVTARADAHSRGRNQWKQNIQQSPLGILLLPLVSWARFQRRSFNT